MKTLKIEAIHLSTFLSPLNREDENKLKKKKRIEQKNMKKYNNFPLFQEKKVKFFILCNLI